MKYEIILSPQGRAQFHDLSAYDRAKVRGAIDEHLQQHPTAESRSRIKRLRDVRKPQYRLRVDNLRVFYDVEADTVIVHGIVEKAHAAEWLAQEGEPT
ncbi:MAG: type II toxin-antitoxin system RelE/ParE family toxin [Lentisphaerae bacterium]|nr:type II toxin-antitoxin system RelE/ParE family toxin [Lentisphaerota bacterium]